MATRVHYRGPRDAGGPGSGTGPGSDFVSTLFAATSLDEIEAVTAREAVSSFGLRNLRLHRGPAGKDGPTAAGRDTILPLAIDMRRATRESQRACFALEGAAEPVALVVDWPEQQGPDPEATEWRGFLAIVAARVRTALELEDQRLVATRLEKTVRIQTALYRVPTSPRRAWKWPTCWRASTTWSAS